MSKWLLTCFTDAAVSEFSETCLRYALEPMLTASASKVPMRADPQRPASALAWVLQVAGGRNRLLEESYATQLHRHWTRAGSA